MRELVPGPGPMRWRDAPYLRALHGIAAKARQLVRLIEHSAKKGEQVCGSEWALVQAVRRFDRVKREEGYTDGRYKRR